MADNDAHVCPRRFEGPVPEFVGRQDQWLTDRWQGGDWPQEYGAPPRACSYCGGLHPDDAINLVNAGWEVDTNTSASKWILEPPGSTALNKVLIEAIGSHSGMEDVVPPHSIKPQVKFYAQHASSEQVETMLAKIKQQGD